MWIYLLALRGRFWAVRLPPDGPEPVSAARVVAIVPARNEASVIARSIGSLIAQTHASLQVILVDDHSEDDTVAAARAIFDPAGRLSIMEAAPLPAGWSGKLWAVQTGIAAAMSLTPDFILLTDADIVHDPSHVDRLVARADVQRRAMVSEMVLLRCRSLPERLLIPAFVFFFFMLYPPAWANDRRRSLAAAAGGCVLIRPAALDAVGGIEAIRHALIDDCVLASAVKAAGFDIRLDLTRNARSIRTYGRFADIWDMVARTAFTQLHHSPALLAGTVLGLMLTYLAPPLLVLMLPWSLATALLGGVGWVVMSIAYFPLVRFYGLHAGYAVCLPGIAAFYLAATLGSAVAYWRGHGGSWKGRVQAPG